MKIIRTFLTWLVLLALGAALVIGGLITFRGCRMYKAALAQQSLAQTVEAIRAQPGYTPLSGLPQIYLNAVIAVEDHRFTQHGGVDPIAIARATLHDLATRSLDQGGSTITQQVAKNLFFTQEKEFSRKIAEVFMAFALERSYTKGEILELYVNTIYFGDGYYGVSAACAGYFGKAPGQLTDYDFGKAPGQLTDYEATLLAGIPNAPSVYSLSANPDLASQRQAYVVRQMVKYGYLTQEEADAITP